MSDKRNPTPPSSGGGGTLAGCTTEPCPTLEIVDRNTGNVVSGTTQTKIVGQKVELQVRTKPAGQAITNIQWTIPGMTVKSYTQLTAAGTKTDLTTRDLQLANINFYWISGGNKQAQVSADVAGATLTASVTYNVLAPTSVTMTSVTGTLAVGNPGFPGAGLELHYGTNTTPGITWTLTSTAPAGGDGQIAGTQLVNSHRRRTTNAGVVQNHSSGGTFMLDTRVHYPPGAVPISAGNSATWTSNDSPGTPLTSGLRSKEVLSTDFKLYFMYRPDGTDSIWVTIGLLEWGFSGETTRIGAPAATDNQWNPATNVSNTVNPSGSASTTVPEWVDNIASQAWH